jgi:hypothetical protein
MDDGSSLLVSMLVSTVGFGLLVYGKKQSRVPQLSAGILMMIYPYFVPGVWIPIAIAGVLLALMGLAIRMGL